MDLRILGTTSQNKIKEAEYKLSFSLPQDYAEFLLSHNGCVTTNYNANKIWIEDIKDYIVIDSLFGVSMQNDGIDVVSVTKMFEFDILPETVLVGDTIQHGFIVLVCGGLLLGQFLCV